MSSVPEKPVNQIAYHVEKKTDFDWRIDRLQRSCCGYHKLLVAETNPVVHTWFTPLQVERMNHLPAILYKFLSGVNLFQASVRDH